MDEEEEDMYAPDEGVGGVENGGSGHYQAGNAYASNPQANAEEEGEEIEEDDSDSVCMKASLSFWTIINIFYSRT